MTYLSGRVKKQRQGIRYFIYVAVVVIVAIFWLSIKSSSYSVLESTVIRYANLKESLKSIPLFFETYTTSRVTLVQRAKTLEVTVENLENEIAEKDARLKELGMTEGEIGSANGQAIVMYPLMSDITRIYSTILLSKGYKDGVEKDAYVYVRGLQPVCLIKEVYTSTSLCELLSSAGIVTDAVTESSVASSTTISLTLVGRGGGSFLGDVARDTPISVGDKVMLRSDHSMTIGTVVDVLHNNQDTSWHVFVRGAYNPLTSSVFYLRKK